MLQSPCPVAVPGEPSSAATAEAPRGLAVMEPPPSAQHRMALRPRAPLGSHTAAAVEGQGLKSRICSSQAEVAQNSLESSGMNQKDLQAKKDLAAQTLK